MVKCVACPTDCDRSLLHQFTSKPHLRDKWLTALTKDDSEKAALDVKLRTAPGRRFVCIDHFDDDAFEETEFSRFLKADAIPLSKRSTPSYSNPTVTYNSPPPTPRVVPLSSTPVARPLLARPLRLIDAPVPPCCRCCCNKEPAVDLKKDVDWAPPTPTITNLPLSKYFIVSKASLVQLLSRCNSCPSGQNDLTFTEDAHALSCTGKCTSCGVQFKWSNSRVLPTANSSSKEKLREVNMDMCVGSAVTAVGTARLNYFLKAVGLNVVSKRTFHRHKNDYLLPAVTQVFTQAQEELFERVKDRLSKGEQLHVAGDGSFDTRGYSAEWCRYFLVDAHTGEALVHVIMNKKETGSSGTLEVACLEKALDILSDKIGGVHLISTLTDRHSGAIKMVKQKYPSINHFFDPWHYFRNLTLNLIKICKPIYMQQIRDTWSRILINKAYDAVLKAQGNGTLASEMFRSSLLCCAGVHNFSNDPSFTQFKQCLHGPPPSNFPYIPIDGRVFKRLQSEIYTEKNIQDIQNVSYLLKTSTNESLNQIAWRYAPKECYFDRKGHELRTMEAVLHWNELKRDEANGTRTIIGKKSHYNNTLKKHVFRNVKSTAKNAWRETVKNKCYQLRASLSSTPYGTVKKEKEELQKNRDLWNSMNTPTVPHSSDANLDESEDEDDLPSSSQVEGEPSDDLLQEIRLLIEEDAINDQLREEENDDE